MNPLPRIAAACMAGAGFGACSSANPANVEAAPWLLLGALLFAWLGWWR
jgi:hypothetical protein